MLLSAEMDHVCRFPTPLKLARYTELALFARESTGKTIIAKIAKQDS
jgi:hypothetical protein